MNRLVVALMLASAGWFIAVQDRKTLDWPYEPGTPLYALGNNFGAYQQYNDTAPYYHDGIDILSGKPNRSVFAVASGRVMRVETGDPLYSGIVIGTPGEMGPGYEYWHLRNDSIAFKLGDSVTMGDKIGEVVDWQAPDKFDHIHLCKVLGVGNGRLWERTEIAGDPLADLHPLPDTTPPKFEALDGNRPFRFSNDKTGLYVAPTGLEDSIDIVARVSDLLDKSPWKLAPHRVLWTVEASPAAPVVGPALLLDGRLGEEGIVVETLYRNDSTVRSAGNYNLREFSFVLTHAHDDRPIVASHRGGAWNTRAVANGRYTVRVVAKDRAGNEAVATQSVTVNNR